jgi:hypothetical protein
MAAIWTFSGENWEPMKYLQAGFTIGAGVVLYLTLKKHKGSLFAFGVVSLTMLNARIFYTSGQIYTEGVALFFLVLTLYFVKNAKPKFWPLGGISAALTFAARYPIIIQALAIVAVETIIQRNLRIFTRVMMAAVPVFALVVLAIFIKTGGFEVALEKDSSLTSNLSPYYIVNSVSIWGYAILLVPITFLFKRTYTDKYNYTFIAWFLVAIVFWSANAANQQERFAFQFTPAIYYLAILAIENILKSRLSVNYFKRPVSRDGSPELETLGTDQPVFHKGAIANRHYPNDEEKRIPIPSLPGYYRKEGELENIIYQDGFDD